MVAREVGKHGRLKSRTVDAGLVEAVAGHFHRGGGSALLAEAVKQGLHFYRRGRGVGGVFERAPKAVAHRTDNGGFVAKQIGRLGKPLGNRGFAVGTGYAPDFEAV